MYALCLVGNKFKYIKKTERNCIFYELKKSWRTSRLESKFDIHAYGVGGDEIKIRPSPHERQLRFSLVRSLTQFHFYLVLSLNALIAIGMKFIQQLYCIPYTTYTLLVE